MGVCHTTSFKKFEVLTELGCGDRVERTGRGTNDIVWNRTVCIYDRRSSDGKKAPKGIVHK
eukprot:2823515-Amphidinium_carterae.1